MGKISYRPNRSHKQDERLDLQREDKRTGEKQSKQYEKEEVFKQEQSIQNKEPENVINLNNVKPIGDLDCDYHIYLEDYVYTYLYQYAQVDLSTESSAVFLGQYYPESKGVVVRGIIPIPMEKLSADSDWIDEGVMLEVEKEREKYFGNEKVIGWMHMQPGYGTMLTMKELREHRRIFGEADSIFMLVDAINKIETLYAYENEELKEQSGYYMYYERNEEMQKYMLDHPFVKKEETVTEDTVVSQFREIGRQRKQEYLQRKSVNFTVIAASLVLIALTAVIVKMNDHKNIKSVMPLTQKQTVKEIPAVSDSVNSEDDDIKFIINNQKEDNKDSKAKEITKADNEALPVKAKIKEETKQEIKEEAKTDTVSDNKEEKKQTAKPSDEKVADEKQRGNEKVKIEETESAGKYKEYTVKEGDTLANISYNLYGSASKSREIAKLNDLGNTNLIHIGQTLKVPGN